MHNTIIGLAFGVLIGSGIGLGACMLFFDEPLLFPGDTIAIGGVVCGALGFFVGEPFIEFMKEHWWRF